MGRQPFVLPLKIVGKTDLNRLLRELEALNDYLIQTAVRQHGTPMTLPKLSGVLEEIAKANNFNLLEDSARHKLQTALESLKTNAPIVHISFSSDPPPAFLHKILEWFRREVHPMVLLQIGLQPSIAAGCIVRTPSRYFDFSLRRDLVKKSDMLVKRITSLGAEHGQ